MAAAPPTERYSLSQARRIALRAQGLATPRPAFAGPVTMRHFQQVVDRLGLLQIDSVNVLARAHLMPAYSRLGPYDPALLDRAAGSPPRRLVEAWAHEASFVPPETFRLLEWRRRAYRSEAWGGIAAVPGSSGAGTLLDDVRALVGEHGPVTAARVHELLDAERPQGAKQWGWNWTEAKRALEYLFFVGEVTSAGRNAQFERRYDLTERVLPPGVLARALPDDADAVRELVAIAARAHGIGTQRCLGDYFRLKQARLAPAVADLVDEGVLVPGIVAGWERPVLRHRDATLPRRATGAALLSPFDPLVFERRRLEELFGLRYRIEIYVPAPLRVWGYYVLPFLVGESLEALVDLKADRKDKVLRVHGAHRAPAPARSGASDAEVVEQLATELALMARWLGLEAVAVGDAEGTAVGDLATHLHTAVRAVPVG
ncbi:winged helix-turn-helix domain-containing protein [Cellulomonas edaphi]|uniref:Crosslink repair DNA glycosylase YcaQ family protein n=1 Tax=Cellulomonas edaphi TaxID=3053468 RepID=A0ABT7S7Z1_9CELL|nr:crosslink repair DNA glycosylase YcaQ family protein [Cellulomons edaphi]MDM7831722.1 crosslink repair DNA glycosylase YcaQ family protein [Cellulomons edaphi]